VTDETIQFFGVARRIAYKRDSQLSIFVAGVLIDSFVRYDHSRNLIETYSELCVAQQYRSVFLYYFHVASAVSVFSIFLLVFSSLRSRYMHIHRRRRKIQLNTIGYRI